MRCHEAVDTACAVAKFCDVRVYYGGNYVCFFGAKQDTEVAHYLLDLFVGCSEADWQILRRSRRPDIDTGIRGRKSFFRGFTTRMRTRLNELREARETQHRAASGSNALVALKEQIVSERYVQHAKEIGLRTRRARSRSGTVAGANYDAGTASANQTNITAGIGGRVQSASGATNN